MEWTIHHLGSADCLLNVFVHPPLQHILDLIGAVVVKTFQA